MNERRAFGLVIRLAIYYAALAAVAVLVAQWIPRWGALLGEKTPGAAVVAMLSALGLMAPVAWMYMRTKPKLRYDPSLVQTVIVLPVVISGVVLILWRFDIGTAPTPERVQGRLIVETPIPTAAHTTIAGVLEQHARRWKLTGSESAAPGHTALTFAVRLRGQSSADALLAALRRDAAAQITAVRFEPDLR